MEFIYGHSTFITIAIIIFCTLYISYIVRVIRAQRVLGGSWANLLFKLIVRGLVLALLMVALMGPSFGPATKELKAEGKDIFFLVDLSKSMDAFDIPPTRLEKMKFELKNMVNAFATDRSGLIIFGSEAFMQCPLTYDNGAMNLFIESLNTDLVPGGGTDFGPPILMAVEKLSTDIESGESSKSKIIVLISDGEDFGEGTEAAIDFLKKSGISLFTLGIGTLQGSKIREGSGFRKDREGREIISRLDPEQLKKMAANTNGKYFEINATTNDINRLINTIKQLEGISRDVKQVDTTANKYFYFLMAALGLIALDLMTSVKLVKI